MVQEVYTLSLQGNFWLPAGLLRHELGHSLGLLHTCGSLCDIGGDDCDDTPQNPNCWNAPTCSNNVMDYNACSCALTECQSGKMHYYLMGKAGNISNIDDVVIKDYCTYSPNETITIQTGDTVIWNSEKNLKGNLVIQSKAILILQCDISLPLGAEITVNSGGTLIIDEGTLKNNCGDMWKSINIQPGGKYIDSSITNADLFMMDTKTDLGIEPNPSTSPMWISEDIWVRNQQDGFNQTHQNPEYNATNYVYVKIRNRGCTSSLGTEKLKLYWAKASTGLGWPAQWEDYNPDPTTFGDGSCTQTVTYGDELPASKATNGITLSTPIAAGGSTIIEIPWYPPNPDDFACFGTDQSHFCLLARIESSDDPMASTETTSIYENVRNNNNIAWKNINVVKGSKKKSDSNGLIVHNTANTAPITIRFLVPQEESENPFLEQGTVIIDLGKTVYEKWVAGGMQGEGIEVCQKGKNKAILKIKYYFYIIKLNQSKIV